MGKFPLDLSERAENLVMSMERRYHAWAEDLPEPFRQMALNESTFSGQPGESAFKTSVSLNPLHTRTPWLFWDLFENLADEEFLAVAEAGAFYILSTILVDHLVDGQSKNPALTILFQQMLRQHSQVCFRGIFPPDVHFWESYDRYDSAYLKALGIEVDAQTHPSDFTYESFIDSAGPKAAPMLVTIAALSEASGQPGLQEPIEKSLMCLAVAGQLHDDILDWESDYEQGHLTHVLLRILPENGWDTEKRPPVQELKAIIADQWTDLAIFRDVIEWFTKADDAVKDLNCPGWKKYLSEYRNYASIHQRTAAARHLLYALTPLIDEAQEKKSLSQ